MFLSRIVLPESAQTARFLADWHQLHHAVLTSCPRGGERALFRLEPPRRRAEQPRVLLLQSARPPAWGNELWPPGTQFDVPREMPLGFTRGRRFRFRLRANPTLKKKVDGRDQGCRHAVLGEERQLGWLKRKAEAGGFSIDACFVVDENEFQVRKSEGMPLTFRSVLFEGVLGVNDPDKFVETLLAGIGSGKAFGFGLLSIASVGE